jgi:hypothetical protein
LHSGDRVAVLNVFLYQNGGSTFSYSILSWLFAECKKGKLSVKRGFAEFETEILSKHITFPSAKIEKLGKIIACFQLRMIKRI